MNEHKITFRDSFSHQDVLVWVIISRLGSQNIFYQSLVTPNLIQEYCDLNIGVAEAISIARFQIPTLQ